MSWPSFVKSHIRHKFSTKKLTGIMERILDRNRTSYEEIYQHAHETELKLETARSHIRDILGLYEINNDPRDHIKDAALMFLKENTL